MPNVFSRPIHVSIIARSAGPAFAAAVVLALSACSLPYQQLSLPGPIGAGQDPHGGPLTTGAITPVPARGTAGPPTPMSGAREGSRQPEIVRGTGTFTAADGQGSAPATFGQGGKAAPAGSSAAPRAKRPPAEETADGITLNLAGASIQEVAKTVLGDVLGLNYSVSDSVKGTVTLQTSNPIPKSELLSVFETLIRSEGAALRVENGLYRIVSADSVTGAPLRSKTRPAGGAGLQSMVIPLRFVAADEIQRVLSSLAPQSTIVKVEQSRNLLIVTGTELELASIRDTVATFDVDWMRGMTFGIFPLDSADPEAIATELDTVFANDRASPAKGLIRFIPNRRLKAVLAMTSRPDLITAARKWIDRLDRVGQENEKQVHVYNVRNRPVAELAALLQKVYAPPTRSAADSRAPLAPGAGSQTLSSDGSGFGSTSGSGSGSSTTSGATTGLVGGEPRPVVPPFTPFPVPLQPAPGAGGTATGQAAPADPQIAPPATTGSVSSGIPDDRQTGIQVVSDDANNALIITATKGEYQRIRRILSQIDVAAAQVLLEATIAEITLTDQLRFGVRWFFERGQNQFSLSDLATGAVAPRFPGFSYFLNTPNVQVALNALSDVTDVNIVSSPSLTVLDNKRAVLQIGDEVPIATQSAVSVVSPGAPIVNSVSFRNTGVILGITPRVGENGRVLLDIEQEVSEVVDTTTSNIDSPTIRQRRVKTTVAVGSGESIVLAGFIQDRGDRARREVPLLGNVPVVGNLFKDKNDTIRRTELLIAITPQIVTDPQQIRGIAAEFRDRLNMSTRPQRQGPPDKHEQFDRTLVR